MSVSPVSPVIGPKGLTFLDTELRLGVSDFQLSLSVDGTPQRLSWEADSHSARAPLADGLGHVSLQVEMAGPRAVVLRAGVHSSAARPLRVSDVSWGRACPKASAAIWAGKMKPWHLRYCHTDNVRTEQYPFCQPENAYVRSVPHRLTTLGAGEDQAFPAVYFTDRAYRHGLVLGAATQQVGYTVFDLQVQGHPKDSALDVLRARLDLAQVSSLPLQPGASLSLDALYIGLRSGADAHPQRAYDAYVDHLAATHRFLGPDTAIRSTALHCTWNYGVFDKQFQHQLLETARFQAAELPGIGYFLVDAGYLTREKDGPLSSNFCHRFYPDANAAVDPAKFPDGIRAFTDQIRALGLKPGIWWSPTARLDSELFHDHPDWFLRKRDGSYYRIAAANGFLDITVPAARHYLDRTLAVVLGDWGMDALKMDFWSHMVEDRDIQLADPDATPIMARTLLFEIIRKHLPPDGIFMTCVATGMGNPFIGQWADTYRNTIDIGVGDWDEQIMNCIWALPTLLQPGRKSFLLNNDSVGVHPKSSDAENYFRFTWMHMTMGLLETGGEMQKWDRKWVAAMRTLTDRADRGHVVQCLDDDAFTGEPLPKILAVDYPADSRTATTFGVRQNLAFFNWSDRPAIISLQRARLGHDAPVTAVDFWTGERETLADEFITLRLEPHAAKLWDILA